VGGGTAADRTLCRSLTSTTITFSPFGAGGCFFCPLRLRLQEHIPRAPLLPWRPKAASLGQPLQRATHVLGRRAVLRRSLQEHSPRGYAATLDYAEPSSRVAAPALRQPARPRAGFPGRLRAAPVTCSDAEPSSAAPSRGQDSEAVQSHSISDPGDRGGRLRLADSAEEPSCPRLRRNQRRCSRSAEPPLEQLQPKGTGPRRPSPSLLLAAS
jgi:hypothetical protein